MEQRRSRRRALGLGLGLGLSLAALIAGAGALAVYELPPRDTPSPATPLQGAAAPIPSPAPPPAVAALRLAPAVPAAEAPPPDQEPDRSPAASPPPPAAQAATVPASPAAAPALPPLPVQELRERPVHPVPEDEVPAPPRPVTIIGRDGRASRLAMAAQPPPGYIPSTSPRPDMPPPPPAGAYPAAAPGGLQQFDGQAEAAGGAALRVAGRPVRLFGVRPAAAGDRCALPQQARVPRPCADVAHDLLAARLKANARVSCRVPLLRSGGEVAAICRDASGADLGGFLVAEGLAVADPAQSYDYVGAEGVARSFHRGLWAYR